MRNILITDDANSYSLPKYTNPILTVKMRSEKFLMIPVENW